MAFGMGFATNSMNIPALTGKVTATFFFFFLHPLFWVCLGFLLLSNNFSYLYFYCHIIIIVGDSNGAAVEKHFLFKAFNVRESSACS